jgi:Flp pilus assembly protein CpaB
MDGLGIATARRALTAQLVARRRLVVAVLTGIAVLSGLNAFRPAAPATQPVWVAARNLSGGAPLTVADVTVERLPTADLPGGALRPSTSILGHLLAAPMRAGEPFTDVRLLSPSLLGALDSPGVVAVPVRVADGPAALALVHAGDLVDVIAAADPTDGGPDITSTVARGVRVLATPSRAGSDVAGDDAAGLLIVAASSSQAAALAQASSSARLSIAVRRQP